MNYKTRNNLTGPVSVLRDRARFPNIPSTLVDYVERLRQRGRTNRLLDALGADPEKTCGAIDAMFRTAASATRLHPNEILRRTDFHYRDIDPTRLEAAFAEVRGINWLHHQGFVEIEPLAMSSSRSADIIAILHGDIYAVEIANSIYEATGRILPKDLSRWLIGRVRGEKKTHQLESTSKQAGCTKRMIIGVVDSYGPVVWDTYQEFSAAAKLAWQELGTDPDLHVSFVTGREALGYGLDDAVYPQLCNRLGRKRSGGHPVGSDLNIDIQIDYL